MRRNMQKQRDMGEKILNNNERFQLLTSDMMEIYDKYVKESEELNPFDALWQTVSDVYKMGVATGTRIEKAKSAS